jgi:hypothetical protein
MEKTVAKTSEQIRDEAIKRLGDWNDRDPKGFEAEQMRRLRDLEDRGLR